MKKFEFREEEVLVYEGSTGEPLTAEVLQRLVDDLSETFDKYNIVPDDYQVSEIYIDHVTAIVTFRRSSNDAAIEFNAIFFEPKTGEVLQYEVDFK